MDPLWHMICSKTFGKEIATPCFMGMRRHGRKHFGF